MSKTVLLEKSAGVFLDISSCASSVRWGVEVHETVSKKGVSSISAETQVNLTDCSRSVTWSDHAYDFSDSDGGLSDQLKKVTAAISALTAYRVQLRAAQRLIDHFQREHPQNDE